MKLDKFLLKKVGKRILVLLTNDVIYSIIGAVFGIVCAFVNYFGYDDVPRATFWIIVSLVCIMNLKETPR